MIYSFIIRVNLLNAITHPSISNLTSISIRKSRELWTEVRSFPLQGAPLHRTKCFKTHVGKGDAVLMAQDDIYAFHPARWLQPRQAPSLARPFNAVN